MKSALILFITVLGTCCSALDYEDDIMPIFAKKCGDCHSRASGESKGGLILDDPTHFHARFEENSLVVPGDWDASYLFITLYRPEGDDEAMPPKGKGERLTEEEVALVQQWITEGAPVKGKRGARGEMEEEKKPAPAMTLTPAEGPYEWTNKEGKSITATLIRVEGDVAILRMANGTVYRYPVANLSDESRAALQP